MPAHAPVPFVSFAPGRVCLFGEHQDYLGLPVIAAAIPLGCRLKVWPASDGVWSVSTPQLGFEWSCHVDECERDSPESEPGAAAFLRAGLQEAQEAGWDVRSGGKVLCHVDLPLQAGLSSSSALVVAWMQALARVANVALTPMELARWAHRVEVVHFGEPGGHMDHVASALGGVHRIHSDWHVSRLDALEEGVWVVVDSGEPKDTRGHLTRCKAARQALVHAHGGQWVDSKVLEGWTDLSPDEQVLWQTTWTNAQLEETAAKAWTDVPALADLMAQHHEALRDGLGLSTERLERLGKAAKAAGAWGWKVVGSGGGGCALAWCPRDRAQAVHAAVREAGAKASWSVAPARGAHCTDSPDAKAPAIVLAAGRASRMKHLDERMQAAMTAEERQLLQERTKAMLPVGTDGRPFLALLLAQLQGEGVDDVCVVLSSEDDLTPEWLHPWLPEGLRVGFVRQTIPARHSKPLGTAEAVRVGLEARPEWQGMSVAVFNGDNLPPSGAVKKLISANAATVAFARSALGLPEERVEAFAVFEGSRHLGVLGLIEKPSREDIDRVTDDAGEVWVSMNLFRLPYDALLEGCRSVPVHPQRGERELPSAVLLALKKNELRLEWIPFHGAFLDLTHPRDWIAARDKNRMDPNEQPHTP